MEKTEQQPTIELAAGTVRALTLLTWMPVILMLLIPFANFFIGLTVLVDLVPAAILRRRGKRLFASILASIPAGVVLTILGAWLYGARDPFDAGGLIYMFVTGPAIAGLAGALVVSWPEKLAAATNE
jgi:hypothetical protein